MSDINIKCERVFSYIFDDTEIKIIKLDNNTFIWLQYKTSEDTLVIEVNKVYTRDEIVCEIECIKAYSKIDPIIIFEKFLNI